MTKKTRTMVFKVTDKTYDRLSTLAEKNETTMTSIMETSVREKFEKEVKKDD